MEPCSIAKNLEITPGTRADYESLSQYHYRESHLGPYAAIYALKPCRVGFSPRGNSSDGLKPILPAVGVIIYSMPTASCQMRSAAIPFLAGLDRRTRLKLINANIRTISRCIIEPRFRSLGLAVRLVKETMPLMNVPFIEALAVMGQVNPFFEKAGMTRLDSPAAVSVARLIEALSAVSIDERDLIDPVLVHQKLSERCSDFIENEMTRFLQSYGQRRLMPPGIERTKFILSKLTSRPVYYYWQNPNRNFVL